MGKEFDALLIDVSPSNGVEITFDTFDQDSFDVRNISLDVMRAGGDKLTNKKSKDHTPRAPEAF